MMDGRGRRDGFTLLYVQGAAGFHLTAGLTWAMDEMSGTCFIWWEGG